MWACICIVAGMVLFMATGSRPWASAVWTVLMVAGFAPAAIAALRCTSVPADVANSSPVPRVSVATSSG
jgi:hypothetical protein